MSKIAIDVDGVLANFTKAMIELAAKMYPGRVGPEYEPKDWWYSDAFSKGELNELISKAHSTPNFWFTLDPYPENVAALARWMVMQKHQDIYFCTSRMPSVGTTVAKQTSLWIDQMGIRSLHNYMAVAVVEDSNKKVAVYDALGVEYSIDDKAETVEQCDSLKGHKAYLLDRPWNQDAKVNRRVQSLDSFLREIR